MKTLLFIALLSVVLGCAISDFQDDKKVPFISYPSYYNPYPYYTNTYYNPISSYGYATSYKNFYYPPASYVAPVHHYIP
ncbi:hypothetical protein NPIL_309821 [Nephila pilipes]|uniref:Uncharacterized protein n=1 Tax=Nephila pilipes TaxID=299642 RepID=A0A8X6QJ82_NEPPI|nr:hypothetical protein NPIL_309821 [Nephila pilipes]